MKKMVVALVVALLASCLFAAAAMAEGHVCSADTLTYRAASGATCTKIGYAQDCYECSCGKLYADDSCNTELDRDAVISNALGHEYTHNNQRVASATKYGFMHDTVCIREAEEMHPQRSDSCTPKWEQKAGDYNFHYGTQCKACGGNLGGNSFSEAHKWGEGKVTTDLTCTAEGVRTYTCSECGMTKTEVIPILERHNRVEPTCLKKGNMEYWQCKTCSQLFASEEHANPVTLEELEIAATGHNFTELLCEGEYAAGYGYRHAFTCSNSGCFALSVDRCTAAEGDDTFIAGEDGTYHYQICAKCGGQFYRTLSAAYEHNWVEHADEYVAATCESDGKRVYTCSECGQTKTETVSALEYRGRVEPTCLKKGNVEYWYCNGCGKYYADAARAQEITQEATAIAALGHDYSVPKVGSQFKLYNSYFHECKCSRADADILEHIPYINYSPLPEPCQADHWEYKEGDYDKHYGNKCGVCGGEAELSADHNWSEDEDQYVPATCESAGKRVHICSDCGMSKTEAEPILDYYHAQDATCLQAGHREYWQCNSCGKYFEGEEHVNPVTMEELVIPALGHLIIDDEKHLFIKKNIYDEEMGCFVHTIFCAHSGCNLGGGLWAFPYVEFVPCTHGEWQYDEEKHYATCTVCKCECVEEHTFGKGVVTRMPDCWNEGEVQYACTGCGYSYTETLPSLGHWFEPHEVKASCTGAGYSAEKCTRCGLIVGKEKVDPAGHAMGEWEGVKSATCTEKGQEIVMCTVCGALLDSRETEAVGHKWGEWQVVTPATAQEEGLEKRVCANDESHVETRAIEKLPAGEEPTVEPTEKPTEKPSTEPTDEPTEKPSTEPSDDKKDEGKTDIPKTGDNRRVEVAWAMIACAMTGLCALAATRKKEEE